MKHYISQYFCALLAGVVLCSIVAAQEKSKSTPLDQLMAGSRGFHIYLSNKYVHDDLELTEKQQRKIRHINDKYNKEFLAVKQPTHLEAGVKILPNGKMINVNYQETPQYKAYLAKQKSIRTQQKDAIFKLLLPHQKRRLMQIVVQKRLHGNNSPFGAYINRRFPALVGGLTANQKAALEKAVDEYAKEYNSDIAELKKKYDAKMRSLLPKEKRDKIEELMGEPFLWLHTIR